MVKQWTEKLSASTLEQYERDVLTEDTLLLDIETTGFTPKYQTIYLIGCAARHYDDIILTQFFADTPSDEEELLLVFQAFLKKYHRIITFNGERFDLPFLETRASHFHINLPLNQMESLDIYRRVSSHKKLLHLPAYNQKSIEQFLGIHREDKMDGGQLIDVYKSYGKSLDTNSLRLLKLHNADDVRGMIPLLVMLRLDHLSELKIHIIKQEMKEYKWSAAGELSFAMPGYIEILESYGRIRIESNNLQADFPLNQATLKYFLPTPQLYYYLPEEDIIIPKELGGSIDAARRRPATKKTCFQKKKGVFLECPSDVGKEESGIRLFREKYEDKTTYVEVPEKDQESFLENWIRQMILSKA